MLHALLPQGHYPTPYHYFGLVEDLPAVDGALYQLHGHPAVKTGMTREEVRQLIVFEDELLDASPLDPHALLWQARQALLRAGTAGFRITGTCLVDAGHCRLGDFGPSEYRLGGFRLPGNHFQHLPVPQEDLGAYLAGKAFWIESPDGWRSVSWDEFFQTTGWRPNYTSLLTILEDLLLLAGSGDLAVEGLPGDMLVIATRDGRALRLWDTSTRMEVSLTIHRESFNVEGYTVRLCHGSATGVGSCHFEARAADGEYGIGRRRARTHPSVDTHARAVGGAPGEFNSEQRRGPHMRAPARRNGGLLGSRADAPAGRRAVRVHQRHVFSGLRSPRRRFASLLG